MKNQEKRKVKIKYFTRSLQDITGKKEEVIELDINNPTVSETLDVLQEKYGKVFHSAVRNPHVTTLLNNSNIKWKENFDTLLKKEENQLVFLSTPGGG